VKFVCISIYCMSALSLHIESTDSMIEVGCCFTVCFPASRQTGRNKGYENSQSCESN